MRVRTPDTDLARLAALATHFDVPFSQMARVAVKLGLDQLEREDMPPPSQAALDDNWIRDLSD
jgi:hypothetical protein